MSPPEDHSLELTGEAMRALVERVTERLVEHVETLGRQPMTGPGDDGDELARSVVEPLPEVPTPIDELLALLFDRLVPHTYNTASPGYMAYIPSGGLFQSAVADLVADTINRYVGVWAAAPGLVQLEANVVRWFCDMVGYPPEAGGFLTTGGSLANLTALVTARRERLGEDFLRGAIYVSDQVHHSVLKAAVLAGFPTRNVRSVASDDTFRLRLDDLAQAIAGDRRAGLEPFFMVASAGTTNSGAVDDLELAAQLAAREGLWLHVDAAYGGFFLLTERGREALRGIERADSVALDPHKGLFLPYGTGSLLVRDGGTLRRAHSVRADYMPPMQDDPDRVDFCEISPELSRDFRGLRVWLPLELHGAGPFRRNLDEKLDLAHWMAEEIRALEEFEILAEPQLSLFAFAWNPPIGGADGGCVVPPRSPRGEDMPIGGEERDRLNRELLERINRRQRIFLTGTQLGGRFAIRICVLSFRTHRDRMQMGLDDLRAAVAELRAELAGSTARSS